MAKCSPPRAPSSQTFIYWKFFGGGVRGEALFITGFTPENSFLSYFSAVRRYSSLSSNCSSSMRGRCRRSNPLFRARSISSTARSSRKQESRVSTASVFWGTKGAVPAARNHDCRNVPPQQTPPCAGPWFHGLAFVRVQGCLVVQGGVCGVVKGEQHCPPQSLRGGAFQAAVAQGAFGLAPRSPGSHSPCL